MKSLKLVDGDLVFEDGQLLMVEGPEELAQSVQLILGTNKGEWFLNLELGINFDVFNAKQPDMEVMRDEIRAGLHQNPRIATVEEINIISDRTSRMQQVSFVATSVDGETVTEGVEVNAG
ncbi:DUF2634 domain-containing protein [Paenibacillus sepulcri]|uniref:DUF2634 domain-containing protein n=1 Tax=Paenibacillus sepulcri TaxID=359917 RepID=A0ABS7BUT8_9BACL|nr:DUF2634 domain-containing protein [Paenibacillus sepulcri]